MKLVSEEFVIGLFAATVRIAVPFLLAALGETISQRSGVLNLGVEGMMLMGAFSSFVGAYFTGSLWLGVFLGMIIGGLMGLLMAFMSVTLRANQVITGVIINIFSWGLVAYLTRVIFRASYIAAPVSFEPINIPVLSQIPVLGPILFQHNILVYLAIIFTPLTSFVLMRTTLGLKIRAVGENPQAADTLGVNVYAIRYLCVIFGGVMAGLGGTFLSLAYQNVFAEYMIGGRGWIAVALVIFGTWNPYKVFGGALLFGSINAFQLRLQAVGVKIPYEYLLMLPYILTIIALILIVRRKVGAPASLAVPYKRGE